MKIKKITFNDDDKILAGLTLDFCNQDGNLADIIILVGENGIGKTQILNRIYAVFRDESFNFSSIEYVNEGHSYIARYNGKESFIVKEESGDEHNITFNHKYKPHTGELYGETINDNVANPTIGKALFSRAASDYTEKDGKDSVYTDVRKSLSTLQSQDNESYRKLNKAMAESSEALVSVFDFEKQHSKMRSFKDAYAKVFDTSLNFVGTQTDLEKIHIQFCKEPQTPIDIEDLSTGEKQVVFRGSHLLANAENTDVVLIDEPEISMHPRWQDSILSFYQALFTSGTGDLMSQIIFATHSDKILSAAFNDSKTKIICLSKQGNRVVSGTPSCQLLPTITLAEINYLMFGIYTTDYHIQLYGQINKNIATNRSLDIVNIRETDDSIKIQPDYSGALAKAYIFVDRGNQRQYDTLPTYIRNCIDHPGTTDPITNNTHSYT